ncbi:MAG: hypothetical protein JSW58_14850 [Candidatus Latescibacterota bacterium]|nr:MAG: hypothetical protein JSW58_14850 [Candidatus Latescibacterota bacterium]
MFIAVILLLWIATPGALAEEIPTPTAEDSLAVEIINAVIGVFENTDTPVWPGYDLATQPTLLYMPGRWAVLLNHDSRVPGYSAYPSHWPAVLVPALFYWGEIEELAGQLYFNYEIGPVTTVAVPIYTEVPDELGPAPLAMFAFIIHEAFHQFQRSVFRDMESFSEEKYPILDIENNVLIVLEMLILKDAIRQAELGDGAAVRHLGKMFVAVRETRWRRTIPIVHMVERAKELQEGSAKFVEARYVGIMADLCRSNADAATGMCEYFTSLSTTAYLEDDFERRLIDGALSPADVPRNRIYPTGASLFILLDFLNVPWKDPVEEGKTELTLAGLLRESLGVPDSDLDKLVHEAKTRYDFDRIVTESRNLVERYNQEFEEAMAAFESQQGLRIDVEVPSSGLSRSRSSRGTRWTMDGGNKVFGERYAVYTLRRSDPPFFLKVENTGVLEERIGETSKRVSFRVAALNEVTVDGTVIPLATPVRYTFEKLAVSGDGLRITAEGEGVMTVGADAVAIRIEFHSPID